MDTNDRLLLGAAIVVFLAGAVACGKEAATPPPLSPSAGGPSGSSDRQRDTEVASDTPGRVQADAAAGLSTGSDGRVGAKPVPFKAVVPNDFYAQSPTFVAGTSGSAAADAEIRAQIQIIRGLLFPDAPLIEDAAVDVTKGPSAWPARPVLYGGPKTNSVLAALKPHLPFEIVSDEIRLAGRTFKGGEHRLIAAIPSAGPDADNPLHPAFLIYTGAREPGVAEINAVPHGPKPIVIADAFGPLITGSWVSGAGGTLQAKWDQPNPRAPWRKLDVTFVESAGAAGAAAVYFPKGLAAANDEAQVVSAIERGLERSWKALELSVASGAPVRVYVYPDKNSKRQVTQNAGDGHAVVAANTLHVVRFDPAPGGSLENLIAHEATHALQYHHWGPVATPLIGEGLAVWVAGAYGGTPLSAWRGKVTKQHTIQTLLGPGFRKLPEQETYPLAGLLVSALKDLVGLAKIKTHFLSATAATWEHACKAAGTTAQAVEQAFVQRL